VFDKPNNLDQEGYVSVLACLVVRVQNSKRLIYEFKTIDADLGLNGSVIFLLRPFVNGEILRHYLLDDIHVDVDTATPRASV